MPEALRRPLPPSVFARLAEATRYVISGVSPDTWFGPQQPLAPMAPPEVKGRQFDYPFGANLNYIPRADIGISFAELRALADALPLLRAVIETRKDQIAGQNYAVRARARADAPDASKAIDAVSSFLVRPDRRRSFADWLRMLVEDMLVIDAATLNPRYTRGGSLYSLDIIDGATIKPLIGEDGRAPEAPDPAYQQILHGVPAADFSADELLYLPRNLRAHKLYGLSPVEQIALTVNIAIRRDIATLDYYQMGSVPDAFATLPKDWTADQIRAFQDYFDALMSGNLARKRMTKFMPADFKLIETRQPPLKDMYDEWLARIICYAFSVPASAFVSQVNRATSETLRLQATQEGLIPLKAWVKSALDYVIQVCMNEPGLEFVWVGDDAIDPLQQAQTLQILVSAGIKTREEARAELGLGGAPPGMAPAAPLGKFNPYHSRRTGQFTSAGDPDGQASDTPRLELVVEKPANYSTQGGVKYDKKINDQMGKRGWTPEQIDEAVNSGSRIEALNKQNQNPATRYVNPTTGRSVVIDNITNTVVQVGGNNFDHSVESGDAPGAVMRPPPGATEPESGGGGGGGGGSGGSDPFRHNPGLVPDNEEPLD